MIYAIGAQFVSDPEQSSFSYFARAAQYLHVVLAERDIIALQALLVLTQYYFRVSVSKALFIFWKNPVDILLERSFTVVRNIPNQGKGCPCSLTTRQLSGLALQLAVELGYHRKVSTPSVVPLQAELQKRFFWAAYGYDR